MTEKALSRKHLRFIDEYLRTFNGTRAYMAVYPKASYESAMALSSKLLGDIKISTVLAERLKEAHMSADEALKLMSDIAHGDVGALLDDYGNIDIKAVKEAGLTKLIKKFRQKTTTIIGKKESDDDKEIVELDVELYSAQEAQRDILKIAGKYTEHVDVTSNGEQIKGYVGISPDEWKDAAG